MTAPGPIQLPVAFLRFIGVCEVVNLIDGPQAAAAVTVVLGALATVVAYQRSGMLKTSGA